MRAVHDRILGLGLVAVLAVVSAGCDDFLDVTNPNTLEADAIDPERDGPMLSRSVMQSFITDWGNDGGFTVNVAWFTNEGRVGDTFPTRNSIGRRDVLDGNSHLNGNWSDVHDNIQFARNTAEGIAPAGNTVNLARVWWVSGFSILLMAEHFCEGTIAEDTFTPRGPMTSAALLDSAIIDLQKTITIAEAAVAAGGSGAAEAQDLAYSARVGIARAHLQAGRNTEAAAAAAMVPDDFVFELWHLDDSSNRNLGNYVWSFSEARVSLVVGPEYRAMADAGDPRIAYVDAGRVSQDGILWFYRQDKYKGYGDNERFSSGLEARYIEVEANANEGEVRSFVNERRAVGGLGPMDAGASMDELMTELLRQKTIDFWLEDTKRMADWRRVPEYTSYISDPGDPYYKSETYDPFASQTCWPVPDDEINNNPLFN